MGSCGIYSKLQKSSVLCQSTLSILLLTTDHLLSPQFSLFQMQFSWTRFTAHVGCKELNVTEWLSTYRKTSDLILILSNMHLLFSPVLYGWQSISFLDFYIQLSECTTVSPFHDWKTSQLILTIIIHMQVFV